jgi:uncharacterized repeat protein (TIGR02543 family)
MKRTILIFLLIAIQVISVTGQPRDLKDLINSAHSRKKEFTGNQPGTREIKTGIDRLQLLQRPALSEKTRVKTHVSYLQQMDSAIVELFNEVTNQLELQSKFVFEYDPSGHLQLETAYARDPDEDRWIQVWNEASTYDAEGNVTELIFSFWDAVEEKWEPWEREVSDYNAQGNETETILFSWIPEDQEWEPNFRETYTYENGNLSQIVTDDYVADDEWEPNSKTELIYDTEGNLTEEIEYLWDDNAGDYIGELRTINLYNEDGEFTGAEFFEWDESASEWIGPWRFEYTFNEDGTTSLMTYSQFDHTTDEWVPYWQVNYSYDEQLNLIEEISYSIEGNDLTPEQKHEYSINHAFKAEEILSPYGFTYLLFFRNMLTAINIFDYSEGDWLPVSSNSFYYSEYISAPENYTLTINIEGNGTVTVNDVLYSEPATFESGTSLTLEAIAEEGWEFTGWTGDITSTDPVQTFTIGENLSINANFSEVIEVKFTLDITIEGQGTVNINGEPFTEAMTFLENEEVTLEAIPDEEWEFFGWTGDLESAETEATITMNADKLITATFTIVSSALTPDNENLRVYPNPFTSSITINNTEYISTVAFVNLIGRTVKEVDLNGSGVRTIPTLDLDDGIYILLFHDRNGNRTSILKMIKN